MPPLNDSTSTLLRAIRRKFPKSAHFEVDEIASRSWASGAFVGTRHALAFTVAGPTAGAAAFLADLEAAEFDLRGHILADVTLVSHAIDGDADRIAIEALTVEDN